MTQTILISLSSEELDSRIFEAVKRALSEQPKQIIDTRDYTIKETMEILQFGRNKIYDLMESKDLERTGSGRSVRIKGESIINYRNKMVKLK